MAGARTGLAAVRRRFAWANRSWRTTRALPVILTTHEMVYADGRRLGRVPAHGQQMWDELIKDNDQIFLTLNGHYWPPGRTTMKNNAGNDVHLHITNYQNRYYGGAGMIRLYHFDLDRDTIDVETFSPWILGRTPRPQPTGAPRARADRAVDYFSVAIDFDAALRGVRPVPPAPGPPGAGAGARHPRVLAVRRRAPHGTPSDPVVRARTCRATATTCTRAPCPGARRHADLVPRPPPRPAGTRQPPFAGGKAPLRGAYLRTVDRRRSTPRRSAPVTPSRRSSRCRRPGRRPQRLVVDAEPLGQRGAGRQDRG